MPTNHRENKPLFFSMMPFLLVVTHQVIGVCLYTYLCDGILQKLTKTNARGDGWVSNMPVVYTRGSGFGSAEPTEKARRGSTPLHSQHRAQRQVKSQSSLATQLMSTGFINERPCPSERKVENHRVRHSTLTSDLLIRLSSHAQGTSGNAYTKNAFL